MGLNGIDHLSEMNMNELIVKPVLKPHDSKLDVAYELFEEFELSFNGRTLYVPKFFEFDGATIPSAAWQIIGTPFDPQFMTAAVAHDWLYYTHCFSDGPVDREVCDQLLHDVLRQSGVNKTRAWLIYEAVRDFGKSHWDNRDDDRKYLNALRDRLLTAGIDIGKYRFPALVA